MPKTKYPIFKCLHRGQKGFTLIEMLIVIAILGVIAAVVVLNVGGFLGMGEKEAFCTEGDTVQAAAMAYAVAHNGTCTGCSSPTTLVNEGYLLREPKYTWTIATDTCVVSGTHAEGWDYVSDCGG